MNKKVFCLVSVIFIFSINIFSENISSSKDRQYTVVNVEGKVSFENSNNQWLTVTNGMKLEDNVSLKTGLNSTIVLSLNGKMITIKPMKTGKISELVSLATVKKSVRIGSTVKKAEISSDAVGTTKGVMTASSRASEAKEDIDWDE